MGWSSWFSGKSKISSKDKAVLDLKLQRDRVKQYQKRLAVVEQKERNLAKQSLAEGNRKRALLFLKKQKLQNNLLEKSFAQLSSLEELLDSIEFAQVQKDVVLGLQRGADTLKAINAEMSIEDVERIMDDSAAGIEYQREIESVLNSAITNEDESLIEQELEKMEQEMTRTAVPEMPNVPTHPVTEQVTHPITEPVTADSEISEPDELIPAS